MLLADVIMEFVADLRLAGRAEGTIKRHREELSRLTAWLNADDRDWQALTRRELQQYARLRAHLGASTRANMLCSLRVFFAWAVDNEYLGSSPAVAFKTPIKPKPLPRALTLDQVRRLIAFCGQAESHREHRDAAVVLTGLYSGLRAAELAALRWPAVDLAGQAINVRLSKMGKGRAVKIHAALLPILTTWRDRQALDITAPLFALDGQRGAVNANRIGKICHVVSLASGVPFSTHVLRHTWATWALRRSRDLYAVSKGLGHAALKQTEIYIAAEIGESAHAVDSLPDLDEW